jgi:rhodanese-related sulfurtransferase
MKKSAMTLILATSLCVSSLSYAVVEGERFLQSEEAVKTATYGHVDAKALKALLDAETPMVLLDARGHKWHDASIIPSAKLASYEYAPEDLENLIPNPDTLIVVYCFSFTCPLSGRLADKLIELGYKNVMEYPAGLKEWRDVANYPVEAIEPTDYVE